MGSHSHLFHLSRPQVDARRPTLTSFPGTLRPPSPHHVSDHVTGPEESSSPGPCSLEQHWFIDDCSLAKLLFMYTAHHAFSRPDAKLVSGDFICPFLRCFAKFTTLRDLITHMKGCRHYLDGERKCRECSDTYTYNVPKKPCSFNGKDSKLRRLGSNLCRKLSGRRSRSSSPQAREPVPREGDWDTARYPDMLDASQPDSMQELDDSTFIDELEAAAPQAPRPSDVHEEQLSRYNIDTAEPAVRATHSFSFDKPTPQPLNLANAVFSTCSANFGSSARPFPMMGATISTLGSTSFNSVHNTGLPLHEQREFTSVGGFQEQRLQQQNIITAADRLCASPPPTEDESLGMANGAPELYGDLSFPNELPDISTAVVSNPQPEQYVRHVDANTELHRPSIFSGSSFQHQDHVSLSAPLFHHYPRQPSPRTATCDSQDSGYGSAYGQKPTSNKTWCSSFEIPSPVSTSDIRHPVAFQGVCNDNGEDDAEGEETGARDENFTVATTAANKNVDTSSPRPPPTSVRPSSPFNPTARYDNCQATTAAAAEDEVDGDEHWDGDNSSNDHTAKNNDDNEDPDGNSSNNPNPRPLKCPFCHYQPGGKPELLHTYLQRHIRRHTNKHRGLRFGCRICGKTRSRLDNLRAHLLDKHEVGVDKVEKWISRPAVGV